MPNRVTDLEKEAPGCGSCDQAEIEVRPFRIPKFSPLQENAIKAAIQFSPTVDAADANVTSFLTVIDDHLLPSDGVADYSTYYHKYFFVGTLFKVRKYAACDPPNSTNLDKMKRNYEGLLQVVIDMKWG